ncbi:hypothetical protein [Malaciobacter mytili]|uniref:NfeD-like C-terminal domain-containing protein n=1 Tax=Malaciobacter mytili LMG 24559 TaxID=1032238 RepID=A0AAX2ADQ5_9BACT|nr:hypothetical protein [Malaciobacter mytili]AXH15429.1 hypothetical protein AMYT_1858 [Malaciobacter mytili LMG 24559]RXK14725.1 hypothetical protein CP985_12225 [Malaciobacter mytili LMG 24559]
MVEAIADSYNINGNILNLIITTFIVILILFFMLKKDNNSSLDKNIGIIINKKVFYNAVYWNIDSNESFEQDEEVEVIEALKGKAKIRKLCKKVE